MQLKRNDKLKALEDEKEWYRKEVRPHPSDSLLRRCVVIVGAMANHGRPCAWTSMRHS
jgi:hypothetical protein